MKQILAAALCAAGLALGTVTPGAAQTFPATKPVTIYVITATGNPMSSLARLIADQLEKTWKQTVIVENKPGGGGLLAAELVKRADPDGYSLLFSADAMTAFRLFNKDTTFDPNTDLAPISLVAEANFAMFTSGKLPIKNLEDFRAYGKANPDKMNYAVLPQSQQQLESIKFLKWAGVEATMVPYAGGSGSVLPALLANDVQMYLASYSSMAQHIKTGGVVPLVALADQRIPEMPDIPTLKEKGGDQVAAFWYAFFAPLKTPAAVTARISADLQQVMKMPEMQERVKAIGLVPRITTPDQLKVRMANDTASRTRIARDANIQPQ